jgi:hypothetical protein
VSSTSSSSGEEKKRGGCTTTRRRRRRTCPTRTMSRGATRRRAASTHGQISTPFLLPPALFCSVVMTLPFHACTVRVEEGLISNCLLVCSPMHPPFGFLSGWSTRYLESSSSDQMLASPLFFLGSVLNEASRVAEFRTSTHHQNLVPKAHTNHEPHTHL